MELIALQYGKTHLAEDWIKVGGDRTKKYPIALLFFVIRVDGRVILVDVGCDTMPGFELIEHESPVRTLARAGISPEEVGEIVITHAHSDHIDGLRHYPNARVYLHENEREEASPFLLPTQTLTCFSEVTEIAPNVRIRPICGHTDGSSVVELDTPNGLFVLCGDECYHRDCFAYPAESGGSRNRENTLAFFARYSQDCTTVLFHDPDIVGFLGYKILCQ